ncbi:Gfo/Idh/MocA family protein [Peribacillus loiseleuriae]|uniref:Gfo/Idh/MocA family protein n=1 Tax=Peribacillus loiseleuriae TaxID=1679170 RepID=UPI003D0406AA
MERGRKWAKELGVPFEPDLQSVLANPSIDAIVVNTPTNLHKEIILAAANNKKHIFTEKVLAFSVKDCEEIFNTVEAQGVKLMVSLPRLTKDYYLYAKKVVDKGWLGKLTMISCRLAHNGAVPSKGETQDWLPAQFFDKEQCGTEGTLLIEDERIRLKSSQLGDEEWIHPEGIDSSLPMPLEQWAAFIKDGTVPTITKEDVIHLTLINEAAALSDQESRRIELTEIVKDQENTRVKDPSILG